MFGAPTAGEVLLAGEFTDWANSPIRMSKDKSGTWSAAVALPQGRHRYKFVVDGEWSDDPKCAERVANAFGTADAIIEVL